MIYTEIDHLITRTFKRINVLENILHAGIKEGARDRDLVVKSACHVLKCKILSVLNKFRGLALQ